MFGRNRNARGNIFLIMMLFRLYQQIPDRGRLIVTCSTFLTLCGVYFLDLLPIPAFCILPSEILFDPARNWPRLLFSVLIHANDSHIYYNLSSFVWKSSQIERSIGSKAFGLMLLLLTVLSNCLFVLVAFAIQGVYAAPFNTCAVGFSGVLFALKVILNHQTPSAYSRLPVIGIELPTKYICWAELVFIQLFVPQSSFVGHLCGIMSGYLWIHIAPVFLEYVRENFENEEHEHAF